MARNRDPVTFILLSFLALVPAGAAGCAAGGGSGNVPAGASGSAARAPGPSFHRASPPPPNSVCGDDVCAPDETPQSCEADCGLYGMICLSGECSGAHAGCGMLGACASVFTCVRQCGARVACRDICTQNAPSLVKEVALALSNCMSTKFCVPGATPPDCGDEVCVMPETTYNCPVDCGPWSPVCGDGECEDKENAGSCPWDCQPLGQFTCGNGSCDPGETHLSCPLDCDTTGPICGDGQCEPPEAPCTCPVDCVDEH